jgi:IS30 family transposase
MPGNKNKHLDINDRIEIEKGLSQKESFASIARRLNVSTSTISREVKQNRTVSAIDKKNFNLCKDKNECSLSNVCGSCPDGIAKCRGCKRVKCFRACKSFKERKCELLEKAPFVCGDCPRYMNCRFRHANYHAVEAQVKYARRLTESREGISLSEDELIRIVKIVKSHLQKGWSFEAIWAAYGSSFPITVRTMYTYAEKGILGLANIDLPKKVKYKPRRKVRNWRIIDRSGRSYSDFEELSESVKENAVQMDCVMGKQRGYKCILTLHFPKWEFQIMIMLEEHTSSCVVGALDFIESVIGLEKFKSLFGVILTDRGIEFADFEAIERSASSPQRRCRVFYCDPMRSCQKGSCEKNHEFIRCIIPKGSDLDVLSQYDIATVASHVNSYPRPSLGGRSPFALANRKIPKKLLDELGISWLRADEVCITPDVLKRQK